MTEKIEVYIEQERLEARIREMAQQISRDFEEVHLIGILKGSILFMSELAKNLTIPCTMDFLSVSSYGNGTVSTGIIKFNKDLDDEIKGKNVIIVEDILDTGRTLKYVCDVLKEREPGGLRIVTLLDKPERRVVDIDAYISGFEVPDEFVVGYGLDYAQKYRNLPYIGVLSFDNQEES